MQIWEWSYLAHLIRSYQKNYKEMIRRAWHLLRRRRKKWVRRMMGRVVEMIQCQPLRGDLLYLMGTLLNHSSTRNTKIRSLWPELAEGTSPAYLFYPTQYLLPLAALPLLRLPSQLAGSRWTFLQCTKYRKNYIDWQKPIRSYPPKRPQYWWVHSMVLLFHPQRWEKSNISI